jgi:GntR family transcriptional repressor for pyruvate dehydrogenase complex
MYTNNIENIKTKSLRSQIYSNLKEKLMRGAWKEGEKLPSEQEFCSLFGVSRVTVRAALQQLEIMGLVETRQGEGTFVNEFSISRTVDTLHPLFQLQQDQDLITVMEYRKIVEKGTIGLALEKINDDAIADLEKTCATITDKACSDEDYIQADFDFHYLLAKISNNSMIIKVYELIFEILFAAMRDIVHLAGRTGHIYHRRIIDALKRGDKTECEAIMEEHIQRNIIVITEHMDKQP